MRRKTKGAVVGVAVIAAVALFFLLPVYPIPAGPIATETCKVGNQYQGCQFRAVEYMSLSCLVFGSGGVYWTGHDWTGPYYFAQMCATT